MLPISGTERLQEFQEAADPDSHILTPDTPWTPLLEGEVVTLPRSPGIIFLALMPLS